MNGDLLIVGGYGGVGRFISSALAERFPGRVVVAGRTLQKARDFAEETDNKVVPAKLDVSSMDEVGSFLDDNVGLVVMCVENRDTRFVEQCIDRGIHYVDISATHELLSQIETLDSRAREHGESSNQWVLDNLNSEYDVHQSGEKKRVQSFGEYKQTVFPEDIGKRAAFRFNFSDQHTVVRTLSIPSASTWACFDSAFLTWLFYVEKKLGLFSLLRFAPVKNMYLKLMGGVQVGSDLFIAQVVAHGMANGKPASYTCSVSGHEEGRVTGMVAAEVAEHLYTSATLPGVFHIEQLFDQPREFIEGFSKRVTDLEYRF